MGPHLSHTSSHTSPKLFLLVVVAVSKICTFFLRSYVSIRQHTPASFSILRVFIFLFLAYSPTLFPCWRSKMLAHGVTLTKIVHKELPPELGPESLTSLFLYHMNLFFPRNRVVAWLGGCSRCIACVCQRSQDQGTDPAESGYTGGAFMCSSICHWLSSLIHTICLSRESVLLRHIWMNLKVLWVYAQRVPFPTLSENEIFTSGVTHLCRTEKGLETFVEGRTRAGECRERVIQILYS